MIVYTVEHMPGDVLTHPVDFSEWLDLLEASPIASATAAVSPSGLTVNPDCAVDGTDVLAAVSGGTAGVTYTVTVTCALAGGQVLQGAFRVKVASP